MPAIKERHGRPRFALGGIGDDGEEFLGALVDIDVRILLKDDDRIDRVDQRFCHITMQVKFDADLGARTDDFAYALDDIGFTVVVTLSHHRAVQWQQHDVDRHGSSKRRQQLVAQALVDRADGGAGRLSGSKEAEDVLPAALLAALTEDVAGSAEAGQLARFIELSGADDLEVRHSSRHGAKR